MIRFVHEDWDSGPVFVAGTFWERWRGIRGRTGGVLLPSAAVHGMGLTEDLTVVGLDRNDVVTDVRTLAPRQFLKVAGAVAVLELPGTGRMPTIGTCLERRPIETGRVGRRTSPAVASRVVAHGWHVDYLLHSDRKPRGYVRSVERCVGRR